MLLNSINAAMPWNASGIASTAAAEQNGASNRAAGIIGRTWTHLIILCDIFCYQECLPTGSNALDRCFASHLPVSVVSSITSITSVANPTVQNPARLDWS